MPDDHLQELAELIASSRATRVVVYGDGGRPDSGEHLGKEISGRGIKNVGFVEGGAPALLERTAALMGARVASWIAVPARWYLGLLFVGACLHKITDPRAFAIDIATYDILPLVLVNLAAITLPWVELAAGCQLLVGWRVRTAALLVAGMMVFFLVALVIALARGLDMSCGCFASQGAEEDPISRLTVLRDLVWLGLACFVVVFDRGRIGLDRWLRRRID